MFAYCGNNSVNYIDPNGNYYHTYHDGGSVFDTMNGIVDAGGGGVAFSYGPRSLPTTGEPNSSQILFNPDGTIKQKRWYGPDGKPERDRDYNHSGDGPFPHDHEWTDGKRGEDHLDPSSDYEFSWEPVLGGTVVFICTVGIVLVAVDDVTGIGTANDFLFAPLSAGVAKGMGLLLG